MKKISELGLELIELEDQVLLVDKLNPKEEGYLIDNFEIYGPYEKGDPLINYNGNIIASTKPLEGLPLLVIEDYVNIPEFELELEKLRFQQGYDKARQIFKFTEKDLRKAISMARETLGWDEKWGWFTTKTEDEIIESITKKELWIDVEYDYEGHPELVGNPKEEWYLPKIVNNQIKAVWK